MARNKYYELAPKWKRKKQFTILKTGIGCLFLALLPILIPSVFVAYFSMRSYYLRTEEVITKAVIIDEKNYFGNNSRRFAYSYSFIVDNEEYTGNSLNNHYSIEQIIKIKYAANHPRFNEVYKPE